MNWPLIGALSLSVVGWTMAVVYFRKHQHICKILDYSNETNDLLLQELAGRKQLLD